MKRIVLVIGLCLGTVAQAQVYRCEEGGKTVYSDARCAGSGAVMNPANLDGNPFSTPLPQPGAAAASTPATSRALSPSPAPDAAASTAGGNPAKTDKVPQGRRDPVQRPAATARQADTLLNCVNDSCRGTSGAQYRREISGIGYTRRSDGARCVLREGLIECP